MHAPVRVERVTLFRRLLREPLVHFLLIGLLLFVVYAAIGRSTDNRDIRIEDLLGRDPVVLDTEGLHYVYIGNVPGLEGAETTWCPSCKKAVVERDIFAVTARHLTGGKCGFCGTKIAGVWG